jgi:hypothetical protein
MKKLDSQAGNQLPKSGPTAMFVQVPHEWGPLMFPGAEEMTSAADRFFRNNKRVVSLTIYAQEPGQRDGRSAYVIRHAEAINPHHSFDKNENWRIFGIFEMKINFGIDKLKPWQTIDDLVKYYVNDGQAKAMQRRREQQSQD